MVRIPVDDRHVVYVVLSAETQPARMDPEPIVLSPIFDDGHRMIFEFQRAQIVSVTRRGDLEPRLVAVHPVLGVVGTQTLHRFNTRFCALAMRCMEHLTGAVDLFPPRPQARQTRRIDIPAGAANLTFEAASRGHRQHEAEPRSDVWGSTPTPIEDEMGPQPEA